MKKRKKEYMSDEDFQELLGAFKEMVDDINGIKSIGGRITYVIAPPKKLTAKEIIMIRKQMNVPQSFFAGLMNVSVKAVQAWEQGIRKPSGASLRLLTIAQHHPEYFFSQTTQKAA